MPPVTIFVPRDAAALSLGAEDVARAIVAEAASRAIEIRLVRNGTRGMCWLEPLVEVETPAGRVGYGPVSKSDVAALFAAPFLAGGAHALRLGLVEAIPYFAQTWLMLARGRDRPVSLDDYLAHGDIAVWRP